MGLQVIIQFRYYTPAGALINVLLGLWKYQDQDSIIVSIRKILYLFENLPSGFCFFPTNFCGAPNAFLLLLVFSFGAICFLSALTAILEESTTKFSEWQLTSDTLWPGGCMALPPGYSRSAMQHCQCSKVASVWGPQCVHDFIRTEENFHFPSRDSDRNVFPRSICI